MPVLFLAALITTIYGLWTLLDERDAQHPWAARLTLPALSTAAVLWLAHIAIGIAITLTPGVQP